MKTMRAMANIASKEYMEKFLLEEEINNEIKQTTSQYPSKITQEDWEEQHYGPRHAEMGY